MRPRAVEKFGKLGASQLLGAYMRYVEQLLLPIEQRGSLQTLRLEKNGRCLDVDPSPLWAAFGKTVQVGPPRHRLEVIVPEHNKIRRAISLRPGKDPEFIFELLDGIDLAKEAVSDAQKTLAIFDGLTNPDQARVIKEIRPELVALIVQVNFYHSLSRVKREARPFVANVTQQMIYGITCYRRLFQAYYWEQMVDIGDAIADLLPPGTLIRQSREDETEAETETDAEAIVVGEALKVDEELRANRLYEFYTEVMGCKRPFTAAGAGNREYVIFPLRAANNARYAAVEDSDLRYGNSMLLFRIDRDGELRNEWIKDAQLSRSELLEGKASSFVCRMWHNDTFEARLASRLGAENQTSSDG